MPDPTHEACPQPRQSSSLHAVLITGLTAAQARTIYAFLVGSSYPELLGTEYEGASFTGRLRSHWTAQHDATVDVRPEHELPAAVRRFERKAAAR